MGGVEPSVMFDELNQTQMTFPPNTNKADKNQLKLKQLDVMAKKTHTTFPAGGPSDLSVIKAKKKSAKEIVTGVDFYKEVISSEEKRRNRTQVRRGVRNGAVLLLSNYKPKDFGNA